MQIDMSWSNEEKEKLIGLLLSKDEASVLLALELMKQKEDVDVFGTVLYFVKVVGVFDELSIYDDLDLLLDQYTDPAVLNLAKQGLKVIEALWSLNKVDFLKALEDYEKLAEVFDSYLAIAPFYATYYSDIGKRLINFRQKIRGYSYLEKASDLMPNDTEIHFDTAYHYREAKKYKKQIIYHYECCLALGKKSIAVYHNLGRAYAYLANDPNKARRVLKEGLQLHPNYADTWTELAYIEEDFDHLKAKEYLEKALQIDPDSALANNNLAFLLWDKMQAYEEAKEYALKAVKSSPYEGLYWHTLAEVEWYGFQNKEAAITALKKGKEMEPKYSDGDEMLESLTT
jgi:tetratricopeptide (TPR) repeat protein